MLNTDTTMTDGKPFDICNMSLLDFIVKFNKPQTSALCQHADVVTDTTKDDDSTSSLPIIFRACRELGKRPLRI